MAEQSKKNSKQDESNTEYENFQRLLKQVLSVPKEKIDEKLAERDREKEDRRTG